MENQKKLYKCYKDGCTFKLQHNSTSFITQEEYDSFFVDAKLNCPNSNPECGIQEIKPFESQKVKLPWYTNIKISIMATFAVISKLLTKKGRKEFAEDMKKQREQREK